LTIDGLVVGEPHDRVCTAGAGGAHDGVELPGKIAEPVVVAGLDDDDVEHRWAGEDRLDRGGGDQPGRVAQTRRAEQPATRPGIDDRIEAAERLV
jgi:hypothetical protein